MKFIKKVPVVLLGIIFVVMGLMTFVMVYTNAPMPPMEGLAGEYMNVLFVSGFVFVVKTIEVVVGILLLIPRTRALALVLITPIVVGIFFSEILIIKPPFAEMTPAFLALILNIIGLYQYRARYMPMIAK